MISNFKNNNKYNICQSCDEVFLFLMRFCAECFVAILSAKLRVDNI